MIKKTQVIDDVKLVATKLGRTPTRDEYCGKAGEKKLGRFAESAIRLHFDNSYSKLLKEAGLSGHTRIQVTDEPGYQLAKLKGELKELNRYVEKLEHEAVSARSLRDLIGSPDTCELGENSGWMRDKLKHSDLTGIPTLFISDVHFDEVVKLEQVGNANEYNHEIAVKRLQHTFKMSIDLTKKFLSKPKYEGFICAFGGDNLSGNIHEELKESNSQRINKSILDLTDIYIEGLGALADEFGKVFVPCVVGNHGRHDKKPRFKFRVQDNFEWLIYQYLAKYFKKDDRLSFLIPDSPDAMWSVYGRQYLLNHGDQFQGGTGISGAFSPLMLGRARKLHKQTALNKPFDTMLLGHWHQLIMTESLIINGSVKGYDEYADAHNFGFEPPQQALWIDHPSKRITFRMPIVCDPDFKSRGQSSERVSVFKK